MQTRRPRSSSDRERLAVAIAHDLESSLKLVSRDLEQLAASAEALTEEQTERLDRVLRATERMQRLVAGVTNYTRTGLDIELSRVPLDGVLHDVCETLAPLIEERGASIVVNGPLPMVIADRGQLTQLFQNLISNAVRYGPRRGGRVTVAMTRSGRAWRITVSDQGAGIQRENREAAFQPFRRLRGSGGEPGVGLGLTICRQVAERHSGTLEIEPRLGRGTTLVFTLPDRMLIPAGRSRRA